MVPIIIKAQIRLLTPCPSAARPRTRRACPAGGCARVPAPEKSKPGPGGSVAVADFPEVVRPCWAITTRIGLGSLRGPDNPRKADPGGGPNPTVDRLHR